MRVVSKLYEKEIINKALLIHNRQSPIKSIDTNFSNRTRSREGTEHVSLLFNIHLMIQNQSIGYIARAANKSSF